MKNDIIVKERDLIADISDAYIGWKGREFQMDECAHTHTMS